MAHDRVRDGASSARRSLGRSSTMAVVSGWARRMGDGVAVALQAVLSLTDTTAEGLVSAPLTAPPSGKEEEEGVLLLLLDGGQTTLCTMRLEPHTSCLSSVTLADGSSSRPLDKGRGTRTPRTAAVDET